jgi:hypothetical protein
MKVNLPMGQEAELPSMIIECCSQERTYQAFYVSTPQTSPQKVTSDGTSWSDQFKSHISHFSPDTRKSYFG